MGKLIIIPTPIGNLEDITFRAVRMLKEVDLILAEDTRVTGKLLKHYGIETKMATHHKFNEHKTVDHLIEQLKAGLTIGLVSDAGTPGISDPGFLLVRACQQNEIAVETLPGATAFIPALVNSGIPSDRFYFEGFLPQKKGRQTRLEFLAQQKQTIVLYESPYRLVKTLKQLAEYFGNDRKASVSRELTKIYEENIYGTLEALIRHFEVGTVKGEIVIIIEAVS
ncbi:MAG TPA: 16S rRNA (cytidine(1402)-2'-O)-methyltransferase [Bacteroidales bacterium]|mgnify:CR=1 FL=1|nr:16S rRNA (cytidine(1402)-2'-O)-methyltransferase [Bacteroidales bacterium]